MGTLKLLDININTDDAQSINTEGASLSAGKNEPFQIKSTNSIPLFKTLEVTTPSCTGNRNWLPKYKGLKLC